MKQIPFQIQHSKKLNPIYLTLCLLLTLLLTHLPSFSFAKDTIYDLNIEHKTVNFTGTPVDHALAINGSIPAPTLKFQLGDRAIINVKNSTQEPTTLHWHGVLVPWDMDGPSFTNNKLILPGETFSFIFPIKHTGTYWYHSHTELQEQRGLYGAIVIEDEKEFDKDLTFILSDWTNEHPQSVLKNLKKEGHYYAFKKDFLPSLVGAISEGKTKNFLQSEWTRMGPMDLSDVAYDAFLINGKITQTLEDIKPGDKLRIRVINAGASSYFYFNIGNLRHFDVISKDGVDVQPVTVNEVLIGMGETYDLAFTVPTDASPEFRATVQDITGYASVILGNNKVENAPNKTKPSEYAGHDHHEGHHGNHQTHQDSTHQKGHTKHQKGHHKGHQPTNTPNLENNQHHHPKQNKQETQNTETTLEHSQHSPDKTQHDHTKTQSSSENLENEKQENTELSSENQKDKNQDHNSSTKETTSHEHNTKKSQNKGDDTTNHPTENKDSLNITLQKEDSTTENNEATREIQSDHGNSDKGQPHTTHKHNTTTTEQNTKQSTVVHRLDYSMLKSTQPTEYSDQLPRAHELTLELNGDMDRYTWTINGKPFSKEKFLIVKENDVVRWTMVNKTMMHHPMHLHGHFFRYLNGQNKNSPLFHTVDVAPMTTRTIEFHANEPGLWFFHCHNLYHMKMGMSRLVKYEGFERPERLVEHEKQYKHLMTKDNDFFPRGELGLFTNHGKALIAANGGHWDISLKAEINKNNFSHSENNEQNHPHPSKNWNHYEGELIIKNYRNRFFSLLGGAEYEDEKIHALLGVTYTLPLLVEMKTYIRSDKKITAKLSKKLHFAKRLDLEIEPEFSYKKSNFYWELEASLLYHIKNNLALGSFYKQTKSSSHSIGFGAKLHL